MLKVHLPLKVTRFGLLLALKLLKCTLRLNSYVYLLKLQAMSIVTFQLYDENTLTLVLTPSMKYWRCNMQK